MNAPTNLDYRFDTRVAAQYDVLRGHPSEVSTEIGRVIAGYLGARARVLELGVGTGRIALPLAAAGCEVHGIDVSSHMLAELARRVRVDELSGIHLALGDITALPYREGVFDGAIAVHVLHLVADWAGVLARVGRLVRPGGTLVLGRDWIDPESFSGMIRTHFRRTVVEVGREMLPPGATAAAPPSGGAAIVGALTELGARPLSDGEAVAAEWRTEMTPRQVLDGIRSRDDAESWVLPDDVLAETMRRLDAFAAHQWSDLDAPQPVIRRFMLGVFRFGA
ncbi:MAG: methyltransferase domain-containing protein [Gammaproteobacteria bacterium]|jgi:SAM-dependent methyltransferase|nr:methyltransferase domain-containing protein [Gammaproteobacteria bacterium]